MHTIHGHKNHGHDTPDRIVSIMFLCKAFEARDRLFWNQAVDRRGRHVRMNTAILCRDLPSLKRGQLDGMTGHVIDTRVQAAREAFQRQEQRPDDVASAVREGLAVGRSLDRSEGRQAGFNCH